MKKGLDVNKIFAGVLMAALVAALSGFVSKKLVVAEYPEKKGFAIAVADQVPAGTTADAAKPKEVEPIDALLKTASVENGQKLSKACAACHTFDKGGPNRIGPNLFGLIDKKQASYDGFAYSEALKALKGIWSVAELNKWLASPKDYVKGTKMAFAGVAKAQDRADLVAYLKSLK
jgi:cytochrome c